MTIYTDSTRSNTLVERRVTLTYANETAVNLNDIAEIVTEIRYKDKKGTVYSTLSKSDIIITDPTTGVFIIPAIQTLDWPAGKYYGDIRFKFDTGSVYITPETLKFSFVLEQNTSNPVAP